MIVYISVTRGFWSGEFFDLTSNRVVLWCVVMCTALLSSYWCLSYPLTVLGVADSVYCAVTSQHITSRHDRIWSQDCVIWWYEAAESSQVPGGGKPRDDARTIRSVRNGESNQMTLYIIFEKEQPGANEKRSGGTRRKQRRRVTNTYTKGNQNH